MAKLRDLFGLTPDAMEDLLAEQQKEIDTLSREKDEAIALLRPAPPSEVEATVQASMQLARAGEVQATLADLVRAYAEQHNRWRRDLVPEHGARRGKPAKAAPPPGTRRPHGEELTMAGRCQATYGSARCVLLEGHVEDHRLTWRDGQALPSQVELLDLVQRYIDQHDLMAHMVDPGVNRCECDICARARETLTAIEEEGR